MKRKAIFLGVAVFAAVLLVAFTRLFSSDNLDSTPEPTTATLKSIEGGPPYLRLEQIRPEVIARFLLTCMEGRLYINAGIVTSPERSASIFGQATANYLEIEANEILRNHGTDGAQVADSTIWIFRPLDEQQTASLKTASILGAWTEDGGDFRWGAYINIEGVRREVVQYVEQCR